MTLAGFPPSLVELTARKTATGKLHTLYISPLKALATDVTRNLQAPIEEMDLAVRAETRTATRRRTAASASGSIRPTSC